MATLTHLHRGPSQSSCWLQPTLFSPVANLAGNVLRLPASHPCIRPHWPSLAWVGHTLSKCLYAELPAPGAPHHVQEKCPSAWNVQMSGGSGYSPTVHSWCPLLAPCPASFPLPGWVEPRWCLLPGSEAFPSPVPDTSGTMATQACLNSHQSHSESWARLGSQCRHHRPKIAPAPSLSPHMTLCCPHQHGLCITCKLHNVGCRQDPTGRGTRKGSSCPVALGQPPPLSGPQLLHS